MADSSTVSRHLGPIDRTTVVDDIVERLTRLIIEEGLRPGDQLFTERELMARLAVGRSSLREAVKTLVALGILEIRRGTGTFVSSGNTSMLTRPLSWGLFLTQSSIQQVIESRSHRGGARRLGAERATDDEIAEIGRLLKELEAGQADRSKYVESDLAFHLAIAQAAHNDMLGNVLVMLQHVLRVWMETTYSEAGTTRSMDLHRQIYAGIAARDPHKAREAMTTHTSGGPLLAAAARSFPDRMPPISAFAPTKTGR